MHPRAMGEEGDGRTVQDLDRPGPLALHDLPPSFRWLWGRPLVKAPAEQLPAAPGPGPLAPGARVRWMQGEGKTLGGRWAVARDTWTLKAGPPLS